MAIVTTEWILDGLISIAVILTVVYVYVSRNYGHWKTLGVKQIPPTFPFGNIGPCLWAKQTAEEFFRKVYLSSEEEKVVGFYAFDKPYLLVRDPELVKDICIRDFDSFSNKTMTTNKKDEFGSKNLFSMENPPWKHVRQKLSPIYTSSKLKKMYELMLDVCEDFNEYLQNLHIDDIRGKPIEIKEMYAKFTTDLIGTTAFGMKFNSLLDPNAEFRKIGRYVFRSGYKRYLEMMSIFFISTLRVLTNPKIFGEEGTKFFRDTFWHVINYREETGTKRSDLIDLLIEIKKKQEDDSYDAYKLDGDELVAQAAVFFAGGFETSSTTSAFALYEVARNEKIQEKLRDEILNAVKDTDGKLTYEQVTTLPYLNMVIHETLRMYPILPWVDRLPDRDYTFSGTNVTVKKGIPVILPMRAFHMDPNYFDRPEYFDPERFSEVNKKKIVPYSYFPFGVGPRHCIGYRLGLIQAKLALALIVAKFEVTHCKDTINPIKFDNLNIFTNVLGGIILHFRRIS